ncbi:MAG: hypothetical protein JWR07_4666 [Nevskia sp.]|nr:hypothetical protein [Nevskia sp.]
MSIVYLGKATGPTAEMLAAAPVESLGFWMLVLAFLLFVGSSGALAIKARAAGAWLTLSGLLIVLLYFVFQNTVAQDADLRHGSLADAIAFVAYGVGGFLIALGYARLAYHIMRSTSKR